jgi:hypothetical protein
MTTAPLPPIGDPEPVTRPEGLPAVDGSAGQFPTARAAPAARPVSRWLRVLEAVAGVLSAGVLLLGLVLSVAQVLAPRLGGTGLEAAVGPGWDRAVATLAVGVVGELLRALRRRLAVAARAAVAVVVLLGIGALLWFTWWR